MNAGIYIHIPFCNTKCNYCSFVIRPWDAAVAERYRRALVSELEQYFSATTSFDRTDTIFFGGGTPGIVPSDHVAELLETLRRFVAVSDDCEISLEANPGDLTPAK